MDRRDRGDLMLPSTSPDVDNSNGTISTYLILLPAGIGDAVMIGASIVDQMVKNDPYAYGKIDLVCNDLQAELFTVDPRIHNIIRVTPSLFPMPDVKSWSKGIFLPDEALALLHKINCRRYHAVFTGSTMPFFYKRVRSPIIKITSLKVVKDFLSLQKNIPYSKITRYIINAHFDHKLPEPMADEAIPLYVSSRDIQK